MNQIIELTTEQLKKEEYKLLELQKDKGYALNEASKMQVEIPIQEKKIKDLVDGLRALYEKYRHADLYTDEKPTEVPKIPEVDRGANPLQRLEKSKTIIKQDLHDFINESLEARDCDEAMCYLKSM